MIDHGFFHTGFYFIFIQFSFFKIFLHTRLF